MIEIKKDVEKSSKSYVVNNKKYIFEKYYPILNSKFRWLYNKKKVDIFLLSKLRAIEIFKFSISLNFGFLCNVMKSCEQSRDGSNLIRTIS